MAMPSADSAPARPGGVNLTRGNGPGYRSVQHSLQVSHRLLLGAVVAGGGMHVGVHKPRRHRHRLAINRGVRARDVGLVEGHDVTIVDHDHVHVFAHRRLGHACEHRGDVVEH